MYSYECAEFVRYSPCVFEQEPGFCGDVRLVRLDCAREGGLLSVEQKEQRWRELYDCHILASRCKRSLLGSVGRAISKRMPHPGGWTAIDDEITLVAYRNIDAYAVLMNEYAEVMRDHGIDARVVKTDDKVRVYINGMHIREAKFIMYDESSYIY